MVFGWAETVLSLALLVTAAMHARWLARQNVMNQQLPLSTGLASRPSCSEHYVPGENRAVMAALASLLNGRETQVFIAGPRGSGRTHLLLRALRSAGRPAPAERRICPCGARPYSVDILEGTGAGRPDRCRRCAYHRWRRGMGKRRYFTCIIARVRSARRWLTRRIAARLLSRCCYRICVPDWPGD